MEVLNQMLVNQDFPRIWKVANVCLIWKGKSSNTSADYRPICLLNVLGKLYERLIKEILEEQIASKGGLSDKQYGFWKGRSTIKAVHQVISKVTESRSKWITMISLDVKNAFNSAVWSKIIRELRSREIPQYLVKIVESYFSGRYIKVTHKVKMKTTGEYHRALYSARSSGMCSLMGSHWSKG